MRQKVARTFFVRKIEKALVEQHVRVLLFALLQDRFQKRAGDGFSGGVVGRAEKICTTVAIFFAECYIRFADDTVFPVPTVEALCFDRFFVT